MAQRILIVDDEPSIVISLEYLMKRAGYEVALATDGEAALQVMAEQRPALVILDVMLPKVSGFDVCRRLRSDPRWSGVKILMLTAKGRDTDVSTGLEVGADAYVTKPFSTRDLVAQVGEMLRTER